MLMGVLLTDRFMDGPTLVSDALGEMDHLWNGVTLAVRYILILGRQGMGTAMVYGLAIAAGFMMSPVADAIGAGPFGRNFGPGFALTVLTAHLVYGFLLGYFSWRAKGIGNPVWKKPRE